MTTPETQPSAAEAKRLKRLRELVVLDTAPEPVFDEIARLASECCGVPIALMSLVDAERQWFLANVGLPGVGETPRDIAFCAHAIADDAVLQVPDATQDARFTGNPLVTGDPNIRFYAGAPLVLPDGTRMGTLCVIDREARRLTDVQVTTLQSLASIASKVLVMRRDLIARSVSVRDEDERAIGVSEAKHRAIVEAQSELISLARPDGRLVYVNPAYAAHFGRVPAEMVGASIFEFVQPRDQDAVKAVIAQVLHSGEAASSENRMVAADGSERWVGWTNGVQHDEQGNALLHSVGRDVTERKRIELALKASQAFLARTGQVAGVGGWALDLASSVVTWSDETRRIHDVAPDYVPTLETAVSFYAPQARPVIEAAVARGMAQGQPWDLELPLVTATGRTIWARAVGAVEFEGGVPVRLVGAVQDITQRRLLAQQLSDSERFVRQITDSLAVRIAYVDRERRYRFVNLAQCNRFGQPRDAILGRTRRELTGAAIDAAFDPHIDAVLAGRAQRFEYEESVGGELRRMASELIPDINAAGEVLGFYATGVDITERSAAEKALRELITIFDNTTDYVVQADWRGNITYMNPAVRHAQGLAADEPVAHLNVGTFNTPETNQHFVDVIVPAVKANGVWVGETTVYVAGRREIPVSHMVIAQRDSAGRVQRYSAVMRDISAQVRAKHHLQQQTSTLQAVSDAIPALVAVVGADGCYRFVNSAFERWIGVPRERIIGSSLLQVLGRVEYERSKPWIERVLAGETVNFDKSYPGRASITHLAISYMPLWVDGLGVDGFIGVAQDITEHKKEAGRLLQLSQQDVLTGLLNRAGLEEHLERSLREGGGASMALLYIDLDHFKPVNDQHGHPVGDQVLQVFAQRLLKLVRPTDAVARLGGDEFAVVLSGVREAANATMVADKIIAAARSPFSLGPLHLQIGASVGVAFGVSPDSGWGDLIARADTMLYRAKDAGRGRRAAETE